MHWPTRRPRAIAFLWTLIALAVVAGSARGAEPAADALRGAYILRAAGCVACHTDQENDGAFLAGGGAIKSPFGAFFAPNITPDLKSGLGGWAEADFVRAMTRGVSPEGRPYYPAFPYASYTRMTARDLRDLWAYLVTVAPASRSNRDHQLGFPFNQRLALWPWRLLFFQPGTFRPNPYRPADWNRGAYLVNALGHCGECHTPRNLIGGPWIAMAFAGSRSNADGKSVPNITRDRETGIGSWSEGDVAWLLKTGFMPDGDDVQGTMSELIEHGTSHLTDKDRLAIAVYLKTVPPIANAVRPPSSAETGSDDEDYDYDFSVEPQNDSANE